MKKIIALITILTLFTGAVYAYAASDVTVIGGSIDRAFDESRTLYYVDADSDVVPEITIDGYSVVKKALDFGENRVTVLKNDSTGVQYRFVLKTASAPVIDTCEASADGELVIKGKFPVPCEVMILRPKAEDRNTAYTVDDIPNTGEEAVVFDFSTITDADEFKYTFPANTPDGMYRAVLNGADKTFYFLSTTEAGNKLIELNGKATGDEVKSFLKDNYIMLNLSLSDINAISDTSALKAMVADKSFDKLSDAVVQIKKAMALCKVNDAPESNVIDILGNSVDALGIKPNLDYTKIADKTQLAALIADVNCDTPEKLSKHIDTCTAVVLVDDAVPSDIENKLSLAIPYLGFTEEQLSAMDSIESWEIVHTAILKSSNCGSAEHIRDIIMSFTDEEDDSDEGSSSGKKNTGSVSGGMVAYTPDTSKEPDSEKPDVSVRQDAFTDLGTVPWAKEAVLLLNAYGVINGKAEGIFAPNDNVTREEFVKMLILAFDISSDDKDVEFSDVDKNAWYYETLNIAVNAGIVKGTGDGNFGIGKTLTREDMAVMVNNAAAKAGVALTSKESVYFEDKNQISDYALTAVQTLANADIINGVSDATFAPKGYATRAMAARIIYNVIKDM